MSDAIFRIAFVQQDKIYEIYAKSVVAAEIFGFVTISDIIFGEKTELVVDPAEERLKDEFNGVRRFSVPMQTILRIDEVEKRGAAKIKSIDTTSGVVTAFPGLTIPTKRN